MRRSGWFFGLILVSLFIAGIVTRAGLHRVSQPQQPAYTLTLIANQYNSDGTSRRLFAETRYMSSSGNWHNVQQYDNGMTMDTFGIMGQGVFAKRSNDTKLYFLSSYDSLRPLLTAEGFQKHGYLRTETVLGHQVFVTQAAYNPGVEFYSDPVLGGAQIKMVNKSDTRTVVIEPVAVVTGEPAASQFVVPGGLPINYDTYNSLHKK